MSSGFRLRCPRNRNPELIGHNLRSEEHTSELQSRSDLVCRLLLEKKKKKRKLKITAEAKKTKLQSRSVRVCRHQRGNMIQERYSALRGCYTTRVSSRCKDQPVQY